MGRRTSGPKGGRPLHTDVPLSPKVRARMIEMAGDGALDSMLARAAGVRGNTFSRWRQLAQEGREQRDAGKDVQRPGFVEFFDELDSAREDGDLELLKSVRAAAKAGEWRAARYLLACRHPELSEQRIATREAAERAGAVELARLRAAVQLQDELAKKQADESGDGKVVSMLPPEAQILAAQIVRALTDPHKAQAIREALKGA